MKKILVISWFYPPINSSEGLVTYKLLRSSKNNYVVFTQKKVDLWSYGNDDYLPESKNVECVFSNADNLDAWKKEAVEYFKKNMDKYDIVMTRSMPPESHEVGIEIKKIKPSITWIASFGDPIANNPYTKLVVQNSENAILNYNNTSRNLGMVFLKKIKRGLKYKIAKKKNFKTYFDKPNRLEKKIIQYADYYIMNSKYEKDYMLSGYDDDTNERAVILNHSFASDLYPKTLGEKDDRIVMTYIGGLDDVRTPELLLKAIKKLKDEDKNLCKKIVFNFYGSISDKDKLYILNEELLDVININKSVKYLESLALMKNSDWLILIDANITPVNPKNIFFAAKLADNIGTGNKIMAITMQDGISADIIRKINGLLLSYSIEEIKNYLWLIINEGYKVEINKEACKEFDSKEVAKKFDGLVDRINKLMEN